MTHRKRNNIWLLSLLLSICAQAQFRHSAVLDSVKEPGFYAIAVSPQLSTYIKTDLSDIRIADQKEQWAPHIIHYPGQNRVTEVLYFTLPVIKKENVNSKTILIIRNPGNPPLSNLYLTLKNTAASRFAALSGSDDNKNWFSIADSLLLSQPGIFDDNKVALTISFPAVSYSYFRLTIDNGKNDPLNILEALNYGTALPDSVKHFIENPKASFQQTDSAGFSLIRIDNGNNFHFSKLNIHISSPKYFERRARLYASPVTNIQSALQTTPVGNFLLSSGNNEGYETPLMRDSVLYLLVENNDNPPVQIEAISTLQQNKMLIAWLEKGKNYQLLLDNLNGVAPDYDLKQFQNLIPASVQRLNIGDIKAIPIHSAITQTKGNIKWWIWPTILVVIILLSYLTWSLTRDMKKLK
ncbi:hypothetical protein [Terrimonas pollutisoli]|uniref:hypothetical protein n=1 Tax=Terrimonas pollutisoli TaxID=3034147 RepID=UPI0023EB8FDF|nr:hypothetical protein [Terrimonas sp. H1YJ31]